MKKIIPLLILLLTVPCYSHAGLGPLTIGAEVRAAASAGAIGNTSNAVNENVGGGVKVFCQKFTTSTAGAITNLHVWISSWTDNGVTLVAGIYSHDAVNDWPENQLTYGSNASITEGAFTTAPVTSYNIVAATVYWLCATVNSGETYWGSSATEGGRVCSEADKTNNGLTVNNSADWGCGTGTWIDDMMSIYGD